MFAQGRSVRRLLAALAVVGIAFSWTATGFLRGREAGNPDSALWPIAVVTFVILVVAFSWVFWDDLRPDKKRAGESSASSRRGASPLSRSRSPAARPARSVWFGRCDRFCRCRRVGLRMTASWRSSRPGMSRSRAVSCGRRSEAHSGRNEAVRTEGRSHASRQARDSAAGAKTAAQFGQKEALVRGTGARGRSSGPGLSRSR